MNTRKIFQYSLLILLFIASFLFYYKYFAEDDKKTDLNKSKNIVKKKDPKVNQDDTSRNIIENLKYVSEDLLGNTYTITAQSATLKKDKLNEVKLFEVNAEINRQNQETIYIYSQTANYNKMNNNTVFKKKVNVKYGNQTIDSGTLNLNFKDNSIEILDNVYYVNKNTKIKADKVEIDLLYKKLKISMINKKDKVNIISKY
jgi:lipopolysaccharide export system protein LptC